MYPKTCRISKTKTRQTTRHELSGQATAVRSFLGREARECVHVGVGGGAVLTHGGGQGKGWSESSCDLGNM